MHFITFVAFVTLVTFPRELLRFRLAPPQGPPRRATRAVSSYNGPKSRANRAEIQPKSRQIQPKSSRIQPKSNQNQLKIQPNQNQIQIQILGNPRNPRNSYQNPRKFLGVAPREHWGEPLVAGAGGTWWPPWKERSGARGGLGRKS